MADLRIVANSIPSAFMQVNCVKKRLKKVLLGFKVARAFLITDAGLVKAGVVAQVVAAASEQIPVTVFAKVTPNPTVEVVHEGAQQLQQLLVRASVPNVDTWAEAGVGFAFSCCANFTTTVCRCN